MWKQIQTVKYHEFLRGFTNNNDFPSFTFSLESIEGHDLLYEIYKIRQAQAVTDTLLKDEENKKRKQQQAISLFLTYCLDARL